MKFYLFYLLTFIFLALGFIPNISAQKSGSKTIQPTIMVIPFTEADRSLRTQYESSSIVRTAITKVKEGFDNRGVNTIDLRAKLAQVDNTDLLQEEQKIDIKDRVIQLSGADVYVEVDAQTNKSNSGNSVTITMTAYDAYSGESYANKVSTSPRFYTNDFGKLASKAVEIEIDNFLNTINSKYSEISINGRTIVINVGVEEDSGFDFDTEIGPHNDLLSDVIEDWIEANTLNNYYHTQGATANKIIFDIVKIPLKDSNGKNYRVSKYAAKFRKFISSLEFECDRIINGNILSFTIK